MSRHYTNVPRPELITAINTLPVVEAWKVVAWMSDPIGESQQPKQPADPAKEGGVAGLQLEASRLVSSHPN